MTSHKPPTIDPVAAARWAQLPSSHAPWLHEEVARRMEDRLQWIVQKPAAWLDWEPSRGGMEGHALVQKRYPHAKVHVYEDASARFQASKVALSPAWWSPARWTGGAAQFGMPPEPVQMLWANMALHMSADPEALIARWHQTLAVDGFVMFSCLGPDTLRELRSAYAEAGWPQPHHQFTDMHDWGDMLVHAGFAEPVMDMERITLSYSSAEKLVDELRELGRNLHVQRFPGLRSPRWKRRLLDILSERLGARSADGRLSLTFEVIYGHAFKPKPKVRLQAETRVSLDQMRAVLKK
jgi:malonyl-CoA O-methyltransferase